MEVVGVDIEEAVLGAILTKGECFKEAALVIEEQDFYKEPDRLLWRAMSKLDEEGKAIDAVSVQEKLRQHKCLTRIGGASTISSLMDILFDTSNISEYAKMVKSASIGRNLKNLGRKLMNDNIEPERRLDIGFSDLTEINKSASYGRKVAAGEVSANILSTIIGGNGFNSGVKTGFHGLDAPLNGLQRQSYYILGARPSIGKSALALQISRNVAAKQKPVLYISPEMSKDQLVIRLLSMESGVPYDDIIKNAEIKEDDKDALIAANEFIESIPLFIDDASEQSVSNIRLKARQQSGDGLGLLVIDYLQLLCPEDDDKASVTKVSKGLKAIAKDLNIPVLVCSQLRRRYGQEPSRPDSSRLRGSGQIEQDADAIMLMHPVNDNHSKMEVFLDKHRNGPLGQVVLDFNRQTTKFTETDVW